MSIDIASNNSLCFSNRHAFQDPKQPSRQRGGRSHHRQPRPPAQRLDILVPKAALRAAPASREALKHCKKNQLLSRELSHRTQIPKFSARAHTHWRLRTRNQNVYQSVQSGRGVNGHVSRKVEHSFSSLVLRELADVTLPLGNRGGV